MFLKVKGIKKNHKNKLKINISLMVALISFIILLPTSLVYLIYDFIDQGEIEYWKLVNSSKEIENELRKTDINNLDHNLIEAMISPDGKILIEDLDTGETFYHKSSKSPKELSETKEFLSSFLLNNIVIAYGEKIEELGTIKVRFDESNGYTYGIYTREVHNQNGTQRIIVERNVSGPILQPLFFWVKTFPIIILWVMLVGAISSWLGVSSTARKLNKKMQEVFDNLEKNQYNGKIPYSGVYGSEVDRVIDNVNKILERKDEVVKSHVRDVEDVAHEINTNLTAMKQSVDMLRMFGTNDKDFVNEQLSTIDQNVKKITSVSTTIKSLSKLNSSSVIENRERLKVHNLVDGYILNKERTYPDFNFITKYDSEEPELCINREHFYLALNPVIENAVRYSSANSKQIEIAVNSKQYKDYLCIGVTNWGIAINKDELSKIFLRNYRGVHAASKTDGTGLGLSISKKAMELYGGSIDVRVSQGVKTTFILIFPRKTK
ncbi:HAMP domain-containing sensor histidine kinase [Cytobacillus horneckiae]|uniref:sensor histidine kinase n=1 Tax=Cytobacillus horneckiae TaxID=549687 RepID=UPI0034CF60A8